MNLEEIEIEVAEKGIERLLSVEFMKVYIYIWCKIKKE
jgi:hypothetical protein